MFSLLISSLFSWPWAFYLEAMLMAPLALACALVPLESATAIDNASDYGTPAGRGSCVTASTMEDGNRKSGEEGLGLGLGSGSGSGLRLGLGVGVGVSHDEGDRSPRLAVPVPSLASSDAGPTRGSLHSRSRQADVGKHQHPDGRSARLIERSGEGLSSSTSSPLDLLGNEEGRVEGEAAGDVEVDWQKHTAEFDDGDGACLVMSPSRVVSRVFEGMQEGDVGWAVGQPAVAALGSLNSGGPIVAVSSTPFEERSRDTAESILVRDVLKIADRCVFCLVVLGGAATAAVSAGMSTFGTGFVTSLEFLSSETAAAATFGGVICLAGLAGTPAGGALIDAADPEGRLGDDKKLALVLRQAATLMCGATGEKLTPNPNTRPCFNGVRDPCSPLTWPGR